MAIRERTCPVCEKQFSYEVSRGKDRRFCGKKCAAISVKAKMVAASAQWPVCSVAGCCEKVRSAGAAYCEMHYSRMRRRGTVRRLVEDSPPQRECVHTSGYILEYLPYHPLWGRVKGRIYQHRRVYYDHHGDGECDCHWCGSRLSWSTMHVDHVNAKRDDNRIENLVAACPACNKRRGEDKVKAAARRMSSAQLTLNGETRCVSEWAEIVGVSPTALKWRITNGWPVERALTEGRGKYGPKPRAA